MITQAEEIAVIVRESYITVLRWLKRYLSEGVDGLVDVPRPGRSTTVTEAYRKRLLEVVRRRPRSLGLEYSMWTLRRLSDYLAEKNHDEHDRRSHDNGFIPLSSQWDR
jgi:transposase